MRGPPTKLPQGGRAILTVGFLSTLIFFLASQCASLPPVAHFCTHAIWVCADFSAAFLAICSYRQAPPLNKRIQWWFMIGWSATAVGQFCFQLQVLFHIPVFPAPSDFFFLWLGPCMGMGFWTALKSRLSVGEHQAAILDILSTGIAILTIILCLYLPLPSELTPVATTLLVAYPLLLLTTAGIGFFVLLLGRLSLDPGKFLILGGLLANGTTKIHWNIELLRHVNLYGQWGNYAFALTTLMMAWGSSLWSTHLSHSRRYRRACEFILRLIPLLVMIVAVITLAFCHRMNSPAEYLVRLGAAVTIVLAFFRQSLLLRDLDENLAIESRMLAHESYFNTIVEHTSDVVFGIAVEKNEVFRYTYINRAGREVAIRGGEFIGLQPHEFFPKEFADRFVENYRRCLHTASTIKYEQQIPSHGGPLWVETALVPVDDGEGQIRHIMGITRNISAQKVEMEASHKLQSELQHRVAERTQQLEAAYREMESFSYSVSHDLRAPLRSIRGFCRILIEDYGPRLDAHGRSFLLRIANHAQRMGKIIDDLLSFSRISRTPLRLTEVNLSILASKVAAELRAGHPTRSALFTIAPDLKVRGDMRLLLHVMENLLGNAWKYSRLKEPSVIEFGQLQKESESVYFVKDNGAGFDMTYSPKLFQIFQRLHDDPEFEGTGIGLAIVSRIIDRHGGKIWADGKVGQGATFYFTIPHQP